MEASFPTGRAWLVVRGQEDLGTGSPSPAPVRGPQALGGQPSRELPVLVVFALVGTGVEGCRGAQLGDQHVGLHLGAQEGAFAPHWWCC